MKNKTWLWGGIIADIVYVLLFIGGNNGNPLFGFPIWRSECVMQVSEGIMFGGCPLWLELRQHWPLFIYGLVIYFLIGAILGLIIKKIRNRNQA